MKTHSRFARLVMLSGFLALGVSLHAQTKGRAEAHDEATALFIAGNDEAAEKALSDANRNPKNSAEWHLETANALAHAAFAQVRANRPQKADAAARRAVQQADLAAQKTSSPLIAAAAQELAGFVHEKLLGDYAGAKVRYHEAARRHPQGSAANEAKRIEKIEEEADRKARQPRG